MTDAQPHSAPRGAGLLPCPFCDGRPEIICAGPGNYYVRCDDCIATSDDGTRDRAISLWNRRPAPLDREAVAQAVLRSFQNYDGIETIDWHIADAILALLPARESEWQPIETAPRDGTWILIPDTRYKDSKTTMARWADEQYAVHPKPYWSFIDERIHGKGNSRAHQPFHWMPLPAPPTTSVPSNLCGGET